MSLDGPWCRPIGSGLIGTGCARRSAIGELGSAPTRHTFGVAAEPDAEYDELDEILRLSGPDFYLLIHIPPSELRSLTRVCAIPWEDRRSIRAGEALGSPVFWCRSSVDPSAVSVLVGADDETWELALELSADVLLRALPPN